MEIRIAEPTFNLPQNTVVLSIDARVYPLDYVQRAAASMTDVAWLVLDSTKEEILVELKPRGDEGLEELATTFNESLLGEVKASLSRAKPSAGLAARLKEVISDFIVEEKGKVSKQSILTVGAILALLGLSGVVRGNHLCVSSDSDSDAEGSDTTDTDTDSGEGEADADSDDA